MPDWRRRGARIIWPLLLALTLAGCGAMRLVYRQGDELLYWWLDGYADFTDAQTPRVRAAIGDWFAWHRRTQLPEYVQRLQRLQQQVLQPITPAAACALRDEVKTLTRSAWTQALPAAATLAPTLDAEQLRHIEKRFAKVNRDYRNDFLQPDPEARQRALLKRTVERAERLYGKLDRAQRERIGQILSTSPFDPDETYALRLARQQDVLQTLRGLQGADHGAAQAALSALAERLEHPPRIPEHPAKTQFDCRLAADLHNLTTPEQRRTARERLQGWEGDFKALAAGR